MIIFQRYFVIYGITKIVKYTAEAWDVFSTSSEHKLQREPHHNMSYLQKEDF